MVGAVVAQWFPQRRTTGRRANGLSHLTAIAGAIKQGERDFPALINAQIKQLEAAGLRPDYLEIRHALTLRPATAEDRDLVILVAAFLGTTRLIDNLHLNLDAAV